MGSAAFAVPSLETLAASGYNVVCVIAQPDKPAGRGMHITSCPIAEVARIHNLPLFQPERIKTIETIEQIRSLAPELIVVVAYGKILPKDVLELPPLGSINVHASLLPKYRGAAPIAWAIVNGDTETGVSTQRIVEELDAGDILLSASTQIDESETACNLHDRLALTGADLLIKTIEGIKAGSIQPTPQDPSQASFAPIIHKEDGHVDWSHSARAIYNRMRGFTPWPGTFAILDGKKFKITEAAPVDISSSAPAGSIIESTSYLSVACGTGVLYLLEVQLEGKKRMSTVNFLRGHKIPIGTVLT